MFKSVLHILFNSINQYPKKDLFIFYRDHHWQTWSYQEVGEKVRLLAHGLMARGLQPGDRIAILSDNLPEWPVTDFAVFGLRGVVVPIYPTLMPRQIAYILNDAKVKAIFVQNALQYDKITAIKKEVPSLEMIFTYEPLSGVATFDKLLQEGAVHAQSFPNAFEESMENIDPEELCSLVYTSGTTGEPKGVMLCHRGFVFDIVQSEARLRLRADDVFLSFLPLSHLYERLAGHWCPIYRGATIHYARGIDTVVEDIAVARPTIMVSVPRL
ncbi:AMP-binding protein, partial [Caldithrix abyssi]